MKGKYFGNRVKHSMEIMCSAHVLLSPIFIIFFFFVGSAYIIKHFYLVVSTCYFLYAFHIHI